MSKPRKVPTKNTVETEVKTLKVCPTCKLTFRGGPSQNTCGRASCQQGLITNNADIKNYAGGVTVVKVKTESANVSVLKPVEVVTEGSKEVTELQVNGNTRKVNRPVTTKVKKDGKKAPKKKAKSK